MIDISPLNNFAVSFSPNTSIRSLKIFSLVDKKLTRVLHFKDNILYCAFSKFSNDIIFIFSNDTNKYKLFVYNFIKDVMVEERILFESSKKHKISFSYHQGYLIVESDRVRDSDEYEAFIYVFPELQIVKSFTKKDYPKLNGINVSTDEKTIYCLNELTKIISIDVESGRQETKLSLEYFPLASKPYLSIDGNYMAIHQASENKIFPWEYVLILKLPSFELIRKIPNTLYLNRIKISQKGNLMFALKYDTISVYNLENGTLLGNIEKTGDILDVVEWDDKLIASGNDLQIWNMSTYLKETQLSNIPGNVLRGFSPTGDTLFFTISLGGTNSQLFAFELTNLNPILINNFGRGARLGNSLLSYYQDTDNTVFIRNIISGVKYRELNLIEKFDDIRLSNDLKFIQKKKIITDQGNGKYIISLVKVDGDVVFQSDSFAINPKLINQTYLYSSNIKYMAGFESLRTIPSFVVRELNTGLEVFSMNSDRIVRFCFSDDDKSIFIKKSNDYIYNFIIESGECAFSFNSGAPSNPFSHGLGFSHIRRDYLLDATDGKQIFIWNLKTLKSSIISWCYPSEIKSTMLSEDNRFLAAQDAEGSVYVWNIENVFTSAPEPIFISKNQVLDIFPNPAGDRVNVSLSEEISGNCEISVSDLLGREVAKYEFSNISGKLNMELDISKLQAGVYFIRLTMNGYQIAYSMLAVGR